MPRVRRALFAVLDGRIEPVKTVDGIDRVVGQRNPGDNFGEVPIALGTGFPVGFRAAVASRVLRLEPRDYHALASRRFLDRNQISFEWLTTDSRRGRRRNRSRCRRSSAGRRTRL